jgi:hypothetical protein
MNYSKHLKNDLRIDLFNLGYYHLVTFRTYLSNPQVFDRQSSLRRMTHLKLNFQELDFEPLVF